MYSDYTKVCIIWTDAIVIFLFKNVLWERYLWKDYCNEVQQCLGNGWNCFTDSQSKNPYNNNKHPYKHHHKKPNNFYEKLMELIHYIENKL